MNFNLFLNFFFLIYYLKRNNDSAGKTNEHNRKTVGNKFVAGDECLGDIAADDDIEI